MRKNSDKSFITPEGVDVYQWRDLIKEKVNNILYHLSSCSIMLKQLSLAQNLVSGKQCIEMHLNTVLVEQILLNRAFTNECSRPFARDALYLLQSDSQIL